MTVKRPLDGGEIKALAEALQSAFPGYASLQQMLLYELSERLEQIAPKAGLQEVVFTLIRHFEAKGAVRPLVDGARRSNRGNLQLREFEQELRRRDTEHLATVATSASAASRQDLLAKYKKSLASALYRCAIPPGLAMLVDWPVLLSQARRARIVTVRLRQAVRPSPLWKSLQRRTVEPFAQPTCRQQSSCHC